MRNPGKARDTHEKPGQRRETMLLSCCLCSSWVSRAFPGFPVCFTGFSCDFRAFPRVSRMFLVRFPGFSCAFCEFPWVSRVFPGFSGVFWVSRAFIGFSCVYTCPKVRLGSLFYGPSDMGWVS